MHRVFHSALIGGFVGIAVLLHVAMFKAGCWNDAQCEFWNMLLMPATYYQVRDLMISGQILLFRKEIVESSFEYFVRGAGVGVILLLLFDAGIRRLRTSTSICPEWLAASMGKSTQRTCIVLSLVWCVPLAISLVCTIHFLADGRLDATTVAILLPSLVLIAMLLAAAHKKRLFLWQERNLQTPTTVPPLQKSESKQTTVVLRIAAQMAVYLLCPFLAYYFLGVCSHHLNWEGIVQYANNHSSDHSFDHFRKVVIVATFNALVSALMTGFMIYLVEVILYFRVLGGTLKSVVFSAGPVFNALLVCWAMFWILPAIHPILLSDSVPGFPNRLIAIEMFRFSGALSTFLSSFAGLTVAFARHERTPKVIADAES